jgi:hypothetical protein
MTNKESLWFKNRSEIDNVFPGLSDKLLSAMVEVLEHDTKVAVPEKPVSTRQLNAKAQTTHTSPPTTFKGFNFDPNQL